MVIDRNEAEQRLFDRVAVVLKPGVTLPMPGTVGVLFPDRLRRGRPDGADLIVPYIYGGAGRVGDRIVRPWREAIILAVAAPNAFGTGLGN